jgi:hypothetical protein
VSVEAAFIELGELASTVWLVVDVDMPPRVGEHVAIAEPRPSRRGEDHEFVVERVDWSFAASGEEIEDQDGWTDLPQERHVMVFMRRTA